MAIAILVSLFFIIVGVVCAWQYGFGRDRFSPLWLLLALWAVAIGVAQLRLSVFENVWSLKFWAVLAVFFALLVASYYYATKFWQHRISATVQSFALGSVNWGIGVIIAMTCASIVSTAYILNHFGTLPILSSIPDKMRFIINREIFGLWEYLALLPRLSIPFAVLYLVSGKRQRWQKWIATLCIAIGIGILSLYASRLIIVAALVMSYFVYIAIKNIELSARKLIGVSAVVAIAIVIVAIAIPVLRQFITYRDYFTDVAYNPFTYIFSLAELRIPESWAWVVPLYLIPSFNLQAMMRAVDFYPWWGSGWGTYAVSVFNPLLKLFQLPVSEVTIPWKQLYLPWWVTATFLFVYWVDFGIFGIIVAAVVWGALLSLIYQWAMRRPSAVSVMLFAYLSFVVLMSIYTNYFMRSELYLDLLVIGVVGWMMERKFPILK
jgi:oligosaccharide repeat unit polymerase